MMLRIGVLCVCLTGLSACVATPTGVNNFVASEAPVPASQLSFRAEVNALEARFREAGWVSEERGAAVQRLTGVLMFGRGEERPDTPLTVYYHRAELTNAGEDARLIQARADLAEATRLTLQLVVMTEIVLNDPAVTAYTMSDDLAAMDYAIADVRQALALFGSVDDNNPSASLAAERADLRSAFESLSAAADALAAGRRQLRDVPGS